MKYRQLGSAGVRVSELCLGTMTFGEADEKSFMHRVGCDEQTSFEIMDRALEAGINFFDTADVYGQDGLSERVVGNWFEKSRRRDEVVLATKFRFTMGDGPNRTGASRYRIVRCCENSLRRLKTDRIDLYQIHCQDMNTPEEETLRALDDLVRQGKVLYIGASNYTAYRLLDSQWLSRTRGLERFVSLQAQYSLIVREIERELVPVCRERGIGVLPWSPLAGGFLSGKYQAEQAPPAGSRLEKWRERLARYGTQRNWSILDAVRQVGEEIGASASSVALAWLLARPTVTSVVFGARSAAQLEENLAAVDVSLTPEHMAHLDQASRLELGYPYDFIAQVSDGRW
jgi:aryl-alcohol dehydrogenase-like predicted oxidoreductase